MAALLYRPAPNMLNDPGKRIRDTVLALLAVVVAGYVAFFWSRQVGIENVRDEAQGRLEIYQAALFAPTDKYSYLPELLASHQLVIDCLLHADDAVHVLQTNRFLENLNRKAKSAAAYILDPKGLVIASSNWQDPMSFIGQNYAFRPYFQDALRNGAGNFYGMGTTTLLPGFYVSHAIVHKNETLGVAVVKINIGELDMEWARSQDQVLVTDEHDVIFLSSRPDWKYRPMTPLSAEVREGVKRTRQYDTVLKPPLAIETVTSLGDEEQVIEVLQMARSGRGEERVDYFMRDGKLPGSGWTIHVLMPTAEITAHAWRMAIGTSGSMAFILLVIMYLAQVKRRIAERESSRADLERAHEALEQKHGELQKLTETLRVNAITDPLTGAWNRRFFFESVPKLVSTAKRHHFPLAIVMIDVDHFKEVNDEYGHAAGDKVLQMLTTICRESLREEDLFARIGGEEFVLALPNSDAQAALQAADRLREQLSECIVNTDGRALQVTVSCGVSAYRESEPDIAETLKRADEALYAAKHSGRNQVKIR
jgi:two-component system, NtrC family, C4-dicarboxylate transport sensor histidine kinase DctB